MIYSKKCWKDRAEFKFESFITLGYRIIEKDLPTRELHFVGLYINIFYRRVARIHIGGEEFESKRATYITCYNK